ncbi:XdhC family protein [Nonomuraea sp. 10N515B]|uniref:XdhC family protein n=1 Tax=Nonomuraea sp. 10N515B TaxID=3457422 RepID=UPI003FCCA4D6
MAHAKRVEHDLAGDKEVPADAYYDVHAVRAVENFAITGTSIALFPNLVTSLAVSGTRPARRLHRRDGISAHPDTRLRLLPEAGVSEEQLGRLRSPIGLGLGARTSEETAVSIASFVLRPVARWAALTTSANASWGGLANVKPSRSSRASSRWERSAVWSDSSSLRSGSSGSSGS